WDQAMSAGAGGHFDVMGVHDYANANAVGGAVSWLAGHGMAGMPVFLGEVGVSSDPAHSGSDALQATFLNSAFGSQAAVVQWYDLRDDAIWTPDGLSILTQPAGYGLYHRDGTAKPSAGLFSSLAGTPPPPPP